MSVGFADWIVGLQGYSEFAPKRPFQKYAGLNKKSRDTRKLLAAGNALLILIV